MNGLNVGGQVSPMAAVVALSGIQANEAAIVDAFRSLSQDERDKFAHDLQAFASTLQAESKFQSTILAEPIKIPVKSLDEGVAVQEALFKLGCGFHNGAYPLSREVFRQCSLSGICVSRKGLMTIVPSANKDDVEYFNNDPRRAVPSDVVLQASSLAQLLD
jgi:hypothetical protein